MLFVSLTIVLIVLITYFSVDYKRYIKKYENFYKTPSSNFDLPLVRNLLEIVFIGDILGKVTFYMREKYGKKKTFLGYIPYRTYITTVPEEFKIIMNEAMEKSYLYEFLSVIVGDTLIMMPTKRWKIIRKLVSRSFKQNILDSFVPTFNSKCEILLDKLRSKDYSDLCGLLETYTLNIFMEAVIGVKSSILADNNNTYAKCITRLQFLLLQRAANVLHMNDFLFSILPEGREATKLCQVLQLFIGDVIKKKRAKTTEDMNPVGLPVLDLLLEVQEKENLTDDYIIAEIIFFAAAATDTSAFTTVYTCLMLALHPEVQEQVYQEAISIIEKDKEIEAVDINKFKYTEMAINETMRLLPAIPLIARKTINDLDIGDNKIIPKNTEVVLDIIHMHRDEDIFPDPLKYDPNRFLPEEVNKRHPYSFLPFSGGPRNCIGFKYAQMVLKITIANIVKNFVISTSHKSLSDIEFISGVVLTPNIPLDITFTPRSK